MTITNKDAAATVCRQAFGSLLTQQGRGYYVTLELLAIVWGTSNRQDNPCILPDDEETVQYLRRSHDFARRWMANEDLTPADRKALKGDAAPDILRSLLSSLRVPIPNRRVLPGWLGQHLYPYIGELIHYDAAARRHGTNRNISIERYTYRGGGGLAHKILRLDPDNDRLVGNRRGLGRLVENEGGPLGRLALACAEHDLAKPSIISDEPERLSIVGDTEWVEHLRNGVRNITSRELVRAKQVELLMIWVPYCIARHQLDRATQILGRDPMILPVSVVQQNSPVRQAARRELDHAKGLIDAALIAQVDLQLSGTEILGEREAYGKLADVRSWRNPMVGFFTQTMATVGALNAYTGSRYLTLQLPLLEALVSASLKPGQEVEFGEFCNQILWKRYRLVADHRSAADAGLTTRIDAADLTENASQLARDLVSLGLMTEFSDATRMIRGEVQ